MKLFLYGYLNRVRSSRRLEREAHRNLELIWLIKGLQPSYKTIANFRKSNPEAIKRVSRDFVQLCKQLALFSNELVAIDGSFFRANASKGSIFTQEQLEKQITVINEHIDRYLKKLNQEDSCDDNQNMGSLVNEPELQEKIEALKKVAEEKQDLKKQLEESGEKQISTIDPDARKMSKRGQTVAGYNVQQVIDAKHKLILVHEVTQDGNDQNQLLPMSRKAKEALALNELTAIADSGYFKGEQIRDCITDNITPYVPEPDKSRPTREQGRYGREQFIYDVELNQYVPRRPKINPSWQSLRKTRQVPCPIWK